MDRAWLGGLAALATAFLWALSGLAWGLASKRIHSLSVAAIRILLAGILVFPIQWAVFGRPWPTNLEWEPLLLLVGSGFMGMAAGDVFYFRGIAILGPRLAMLLSALCPIGTAIIAWIVARETLSLRAVAGIILNVVGVAWVVSEPQGQQSWVIQREHFRRGVVLLLICVAFASVSNVLSRAGMKPSVRLFGEGPPPPPTDPLQATLIRITIGTLATWAFLPLVRRLRPTIRAVADRKAMLVVLGGTIVGPLVGVWTSMVAFQHLESGIASSLINTSPIFMIPLSSLVYGEKHSFRSLVGTLLAMGGMFLLLWPTGS
jgi:drug/metabolite transporter (DMT)-like permease